MKSKNLFLIFAALIVLIACDTPQSSGGLDAGKKYGTVYPVGGPPSGAAAGDLGGTYPNPTVSNFTGKASIASSPGSNLTLTPQPSTANPGTSGNLVAALTAPVGAGTEAALLINRSGTTLMREGPLNSTDGAIWFNANAVTPTSSNYSIAVDGQDLYFVGTSFNFNIGGAAIKGYWTSNGIQFFNGQATQFGGGNAVIGITNAATPPSSNPSGGGILYETAGALTHYSSNGVIATVAPVGAGTVNSQLQQKNEQWGATRTVSSAATTTPITFTMASGSSAHIDATYVCRAVTAPGGGSIGDTWTAHRSVAARNIAGTVTIVGSIASLDTFADTSMNTTAAAITASTNTVLISYTTVATATVDCEADATFFIN